MSIKIYFIPKTESYHIHSMNHATCILTYLNVINIMIILVLNLNTFKFKYI